MALTTLTPQTSALPDDLVTLKEAVALLRLTPFPTSESTLTRWFTKHGTRVYGPYGGRRHHKVSYSDVLVIHRDENRNRVPAGGW